MTEYVVSTENNNNEKRSLIIKMKTVKELETYNLVMFDDLQNDKEQLKILLTENEILKNVQNEIVEIAISKDPLLSEPIQKAIEDSKHKKKKIPDSPNLRAKNLLKVKTEQDINQLSNIYLKNPNFEVDKLLNKKKMITKSLHGSMSWCFQIQIFPGNRNTSL